MRSVWVILLTAFVAASGAAAQASQGLLVTAAWLDGHLHDANIVLLHIGDKDEFQKP